MKIILPAYILFATLTCVYAHTGKDSIATVNTKAPVVKENTSTLEALQNLNQNFPVQAEVFKYAIDKQAEFTFRNIQDEYPVSENINNNRQEAKGSFETIESENSWVTSVNNEDISTLPIGVKHYVNEIEYAIGIVKARIYPQYTELTVFARVILPQTDEAGEPIQLFFGANNVKLSHQGGIMGDANLVLLGDVFIPFNAGNWLLSLKGGFDYRTGNTQNLTYVTINCDGIKEMSLMGEVQFSRELVLPVDEYGKPLPETRPYKNSSGETVQVPNRVSGLFSMVASDWNDIVVDISLSPFVLSKHPDKFMFSVNQAIFDFSDIRTENVRFPQYYYDNNLLMPNQESWRGVYVQSLQVGLPKEFKTTESIQANKRVTFTAMDMIIDNFGVSGYFAVDNLFPLQKGRTDEQNAWAYSVDHIGVKLTANKLAGADFSGQLVLPIGDKTDEITNDSEGQQGLGYQGIIGEEEYLMAVYTTETIDFNIWKAKAQLLPNSGVELRVQDGRFLPKAILNGRMAISASQKESMENEGQIDENERSIQFQGIQFQDLVLQTESPLLQVGYFGYNDEVKIMNFPVSIANIELSSMDSQTILGFDLKFNLMGEGDKGFAADTRLEFFSNVRVENYKQRWQYERVNLARIFLQADMGGFKMEGDLTLMENDPEYGDGFAARLKVEMAALQGITVEAKAIFGKTDFRYWYFDVMVDNLPTGKAPTGITLKGLGGGAFYKMQRSGFGSSFSPSGLAYVPDKDSSLGLKAMILFGVVNDKALNGGAGFEILFNKNGGVNRMGLYGEAHVMQAFDIPNPAAAITGKMKEMADKAGLNDMVDKLSNDKLTKPFVERATDEYPASIAGEAGLNAYIGIDYDFENKILHGELDIYVNVAGGIVAGRASGGRAGWAVIHLSPDEWYLHMGTPEDRLGLKVGLGPLSIEAGGYFMIGDYMPASPPPPPEVAQILGLEAESLNYMRDENSLGTGRGFAFGQDFKMDTGDLRFLIFYARFQAGGGFDIMLRDYGEAECSNTGKKVGIDGWYANGQAYAYLQGELGLRIKLFFIRKKIPIIKGGAAVLLQAKAPNPIWMRGYVGGYYNLLGGLVKGKFRFKMTIGEECEFMDASPLGGIKMITDVTPDDGTGDVDVFAAPQATFSMRVNEPIVIPEDKEDKTYKVILEKFRVVDEKGKEIEGNLKWSYMNDVATFISKDILPPKTRLKAEVEVSFQEKVNGVFQTIHEDGKKAIEYEERSFTTGTAPNVIPMHSIQYCYPVVDQQLFYPGEYNSGYIQLLRGQDYLFDDAQWKSEVVIINETGTTTSAQMNYGVKDNKVFYTMPDIQRDSKYAVSIISSPKNKLSTSGSTQKTTKEDLGGENTMEITTKQAENVSKDGEIERLSYEFKSSEYKTFSSKVNDIKVTHDNWGRIASDVIFLTSSIQNHEGFDLAELRGSEYTENIPLVEAEATIKDTYFEKDIDPVLYRKYSLHNKYTIRRDPDELGFRPVRALPISTSYITSLEYNTDLVWRGSKFPFMYNLPDIYKLDYMDISHKVINDYVKGLLPGNDPALQILDDEYLFMRSGNYEVKYTYMLPGGIKGSMATYKFKNPINIR